MADLEAVLADVSYLMAMEKSKSTPAASASKKIVLPDRRWSFKNLRINNFILSKNPLFYYSIKHPKRNAQAFTKNERTHIRKNISPTIGIFAI